VAHSEKKEESSWAVYQTKEPVCCRKTQDKPLPRRLNA